MITHKKQKYIFSCAASAFSMITGIDEDTSIKLCKTDKNGTYHYDVYSAFKSLKYLVHHVSIGLNFNECWWLEKLKYPIYVSGFYKTKYCKRGRPRQRNHAFVVYNGDIYDPAENQKFPIEAYFHIFDDLIIENIIIVEKSS